MSAWVPRAKLDYIPNAVELTKQEGVAERREVILAVGRLHAQKGFDVLLHALAQLPERHDRYRLRVVGTGAEADGLVALAASLGITERVEWVGELEDVAAEYARATVLALPSRYEGMPNVVLEAMAAELPVVVSDAAQGALELVSDRQTGRVFASENSAALADVLASVLDDEEARAALARAARDRIQAHDPAVIAERWADALAAE